MLVSIFVKVPYNGTFIFSANLYSDPIKQRRVKNTKGNK